METKTASTAFKVEWQGNRIWTQPFVGIVAGLIGVGCTAECWVVDPPTLGSARETLGMGVLALVAMVALYLARQFPIHLRFSTKVEMSNVPFYLMAVVLPPAIAAVAIGLAWTVIELLCKRRRGTHLGDIATLAGRSMVTMVAGSMVAHLVSPAFSMPYAAVLVAVAVILFAGDLLTAPFQIAPITGERIPHLLIDCARSVSVPEAGQYLLGITGGLLAIGDVWHVSLLVVPVLVIYSWAKRTMELHDSTKRLLEHMADSVDSKDDFTHEHSVRVREWTRAVLQELGVIGPEAQLILTASRVHDIGKMWIPDEILHKHEKLTSEEWAIMERHPVIGADILAKYPAFARGVAVVRGHHERFDGKGYPDGTMGMDIPLGARIISVVDSFDAMTSDRPYRKGMPVERAAAILAGGKGTQWDPTVVDAFLHIIAGQLEKPIPAMAPLPESMPAV